MYWESRAKGSRSPSSIDSARFLEVWVCCHSYPRKRGLLGFFIVMSFPFIAYDTRPNTILSTRKIKMHFFTGTSECGSKPGQRLSVEDAVVSTALKLCKTSVKTNARECIKASSIDARLLVINSFLVLWALPIPTHTTAGPSSSFFAFINTTYLLILFFDSKLVSTYSLAPRQHKQTVLG